MASVAPQTEAHDDQKVEGSVMTIRDEAQRIERELRREKEDKVRIALFGQPGAGKSSLINALLGEPLAAVGQRTDVTREEKAYEWIAARLVDLPGYDTERFPRDEYFDRFAVLSFDLFLCVTSGKLHESDTRFFRELRSEGKQCLFVRNKSDTLWEPEATGEALRAEVLDDFRCQLLEEVTVYFTSCKTREGLAVLEEAIFRHLDTAKAARWARSAKARSKEFLQEKRNAAAVHVTLMAGLSAANAFNPIPGADVAVDLGILMALFREIRSTYGLTDERVHHLEVVAPVLGPLSADILSFATKEGLVRLLTRYAGREVVKSFSKYIPIVGQLLAASLGFAITKQAGDYYLSACHTLAEKILELELKDGQV
jgi:GTP-binding protein EngB required for normal cell division/uncharacterized protein (DUF697 family)